MKNSSAKESFLSDYLSALGALKSDPSIKHFDSPNLSSIQHIQPTQVEDTAAVTQEKYLGQDHARLQNLLSSMRQTMLEIGKETPQLPQDDTQSSAKTVDSFKTLDEEPLRKHKEPHK